MSGVLLTHRESETTLLLQLYSAVSLAKDQEVKANNSSTSPYLNNVSNTRHEQDASENVENEGMCSKHIVIDHGLT